MNAVGCCGCILTRQADKSLPLPLHVLADIKRVDGKCDCVVSLGTDRIEYIQHLLALKTPRSATHQDSYSPVQFPFEYMCSPNTWYFFCIYLANSCFRKTYKNDIKRHDQHSTKTVLWICLSTFL